MRIAFAFTGSFCTMQEVLEMMQHLVNQGHYVLPILSYHAATLDTRFISFEELASQCQKITGNKPLNSIPEVEPLGPKKLVDAVLIAPCTGNTMAKLANGITDTPALMAAKSHLRNGGPVVLAIASNDALSGNAKNIGQLLDKKNVYFVPFGQDDFKEKPTSLQSRFALAEEAIKYAMQGKQLQPLLISL